MELNEKVIAPEGVRTIVGFKKNIKGDVTVHWKGRNCEGVCMQSSWEEWCQGTFIKEDGNPRDANLTPRLKK